MTDSLSDCSSWSAESTPSDHPNLFCTLSRNIQRYESATKGKEKPNLSRDGSRKPSSSTVARPTTVRKESQVDSYLKSRNFNEGQTPQYQKIKVMENFLDKPVLVSLQLIRQAAQNQPPNMISRLPETRAKSSYDKHEQFQTLKQREIVFEKRNKKKCKDKCVELLGEVKTNRCPVSLRQMDDINKQGGAKMDLFMKLLRR